MFFIIVTQSTTMIFMCLLMPPDQTCVCVCVVSRGMFRVCVRARTCVCAFSGSFVRQHYKNRMITHAGNP